MHFFHVFSEIVPVFITIVLIATTGWVITTWLRTRNGYFANGTRGRTSYSPRHDETIERVRLLIQENTQLRAEMGAIKGRLTNIERVVTATGRRVDGEVGQLRRPAN